MGLLLRSTQISWKTKMVRENLTKFEFVFLCSQNNPIYTFKTRKNAVVEYHDYQIPVAQLKGPKEDGDMQAILIYGYVGGRQI